MAKVIIGMLCAGICIKLWVMGDDAIGGIFLVVGVFSLMASADEPFWRQ